MIRIAICDDDETVCEHLKSIISTASKQLKVLVIIDVFNSTESLKVVLDEKNAFDLIFLDIEFKGVNGIQFGSYIRKQLNNHIQQIVYISGYSCYDRQLFQNQPFNFASKPFDFDKIKSILSDYISIYGTGDHFFDFKQNGKTRRISISQIVYFKSESRIVTILCYNHGIYETFEYYDKISNIIKKLSEYRFLLIHKSFLVQYRYITDFSYDSIKLINGEVLSISQSNRKTVREKRLKWGR